MQQLTVMVTAKLSPERYAVRVSMKNFTNYSAEEHEDELEHFTSTFVRQVLKETFPSELVSVSHSMVYMP